ncbi:hypothetical protein [Corynebacterium gerontici]|uniref:hypothetical protein n=1 Tax=Corynebacterium gerontici TaxID=2079234 RepID=UPI000F506F4C|nr:hypothetical protein [Corynebacterium gerontici]
MAKVKNPWETLFEHEGQQDPNWHVREHFVLDCDAAVVQSFNAELPEASSARVEIGLPPEPFIGNINAASVILLASHPMIGGNEALDNEVWRKAYRKNLRSGGNKGGFYYAKDLSTMELPGAQGLFGVRRIEAEDSPTGEVQQAQAGVLTPLLNDLSEKLGGEGFNHADDDLRAEVARKLYKNLMVINLFPYAVDYSRDVFAQQEGNWLPSQRYQRALVKKALKRAKEEKYPPLVIVSRRQQEWYSAVPKLQHKFGKRPKSLALMQNPGMVVTQNALDSVHGRGAYKQVLKRLRA